MTTEALQVYGARRGARLFISGWVGIAVFGVLVVVARGSDELPFALVLAGVAVAVCAWYQMSSGKAAVIVGLVLGALLGLEQLAYTIADLGSGDSFLTGTFLDALGLVATVLIVAGAVLGLMGRRRHE